MQGYKRNHVHLREKHAKENEIDSNDKRHKRQAPPSPPNQQGSPDKDIQDIFQSMMKAMVEGGKKIVQKVGEFLENPPSQQGQPPPPPSK